MLAKLMKYEEHLQGKLQMIALALDPRASSTHRLAERAKPEIRVLLAPYVEYPVAEDNCASPSFEDDIFGCEGDFDRGLQRDEVEEFYAATVQPMKVPKNVVFDVIKWWGNETKQYPLLSQLARDTFMAMGSSVPSESAFSDSGDFVSAERVRLSDENICEMMKL